MNTVSFEKLLSREDVPVIAIDGDGLITHINNQFTTVYGWEREDLTGKVVTIIMPSHMRDAHNFGFSRFLISEQPRIMNQKLNLPIRCKTGTEIPAEHYIVAEKMQEKWCFAATIIPSESEAKH